VQQQVQQKDLRNIIVNPNQPSMINLQQGNAMNQASIQPQQQQGWINSPQSQAPNQNIQQQMYINNQQQQQQMKPNQTNFQYGYDNNYQ
jgi:hypothetical protein